MTTSAKITQCEVCRAERPCKPQRPTVDQDFSILVCRSCGGWDIEPEDWMPFGAPYRVGKNVLVQTFKFDGMTKTERVGR